MSDWFKGEDGELKTPSFNVDLAPMHPMASSLFMGVVFVTTTIHNFVLGFLAWLLGARVTRK